MHWPDPDEDLEEAWDQMVKLKDEGKVRYIGVSNFNVAHIERAGAIHEVASLQPPYSMLHREVEQEILAYCGRENIGVVAYSPMQRGLLTGKFSPERLAALDPGDHRRKNADFRKPKFTATLELVERLRPIAERNGRTLAQLAISWVLRRPEVTAAIAGARRPDQIQETAGAGDWNLGAEAIAEIETLLAKWQTKTST